MHDQNVWLLKYIKIFKTYNTDSNDSLQYSDVF